MIELVTLVEDGDSVAVPLPMEILKRFQIGPGDRLLFIETERGVLLTPYDPERTSPPNVETPRGASPDRG